jgi:hypothetical protein
MCGFAIKPELLGFDRASVAAEWPVGISAMFFVE